MCSTQISEENYDDRVVKRDFAEYKIVLVVLVLYEVDYLVYC